MQLLHKICAIWDTFQVYAVQELFQLKCVRIDLVFFIEFEYTLGTKSIVLGQVKKIAKSQFISQKVFLWNVLHQYS